MERIVDSVGVGGTNRPADVRLVQKLLNGFDIRGESPRHIAVDGVLSPQTIGRIEAFQKKILGMNSPDGRVDPKGKTFNRLSGAHIKVVPAGPFVLSPKAINLLKSTEGLATKPYDDQTGKEITAWVAGATIGYGHLISHAQWNTYKNGITVSQALTLLKADLRPYIYKVSTSLKVGVTQNQFDALVILAYNIGSNAFATSSVLKLVNDPTTHTHYTSLEHAWKAWGKSQGKVNKGLQNRRQMEWNIYTKDLYKRW